MNPIHLKFSFLDISFCLCIICSISCDVRSSDKQIDDRPNILLLVADDLGYADLGCYGGDIETPNIDRLSTEGIRFSHFHTSPYCAPTRAMLLSGNDNHIAGMGRQSLVSDQFGYEGQLSERIATIPELLRASGYHTYMAGKWHLGITKEANPHNKGFEHSFVVVHGAGNHYNDQGIFKQHPKSLYTEDGNPATWKDGDYSTDFYTDKIIEYIDRHKDDGKPFFAFAAYTSPHWPLQVDAPYWKKYVGRYDDGYESLKAERLESLKKAGMIPHDAVLPPNHERVASWSSLTVEEQRKEARKMELYAGMVDNLDYNIGRLLDHLKAIDEYENTLIVFMSDNGAAAEDFFVNKNYGPFIREHFHDDYEKMGEPYSFISYGPQWAEAGSAPFRYFKGQTTEGGIIAPMIMAGKGVMRNNEICHSLTTLMDIAPTFYELAEVSYPDRMNGKVLYPLKGASILPYASNTTDQIHNDEYVFALEHSSRAMLRKGKWKITNLERPFDVGNFKLYDLSEDLAENESLNDKYPDKLQELLKDWENFAREIRVQFPPPTSISQTDK